MVKTADHYIDELLDIYPKGVDLSLNRITRLLEKLGNPHLRIPPVIHIAGTNGKGSASAFSRAMLEAAGYRVHVHTSPHLVHIHERYRIGHAGGSQYVDDEELIEILKQVTAANAGQPVTVFEILTAAAFILFARYPADATILEVGLGGRFDATNVIAKPAVSLIMPIALDHQSFLGETIEEIAREKAGIIKRQAPVVIGLQENEAAQALLINKAHQLQAPASIYGQDYMAFEEHGCMVLQNRCGLMDLPLPRLTGAFQLSNAAAAIEAVSAAGFIIEEAALAQAMQNVDWPARMQKLSQGHLIDLLPDNADLWLDGGHNPAAATVTSQTLRTICATQKRKLILICGMIHTKDSASYLAPFKDIATQINTVPVHFSEAGIPAEELAKTARNLGLDARSFESVTDALTAIREETRETASLLILVSGSLYLAGEILQKNGTILF